MSGKHLAFDGERDVSVIRRFRQFQDSWGVTKVVELITCIFPSSSSRALTLSTILKLFKGPIGVVPSQNVQTENPQKIDFAHFWCKGTPWRVIQESRIFLLSGPYFGFYGGLKFWDPQVPPKL